MKRILLLTLLLAGAVASCGAKLTVTAHAPTLDNDGTCPAPVLLARSAADSCWVHLAWTGPAVGEDSVHVLTGQLVTYSRTLPAGVYAVRAWASDAGGQGCDTTITARVKAAPWKVTL